MSVLNLLSAPRAAIAVPLLSVAVLFAAAGCSANEEVDEQQTEQQLAVDFGFVAMESPTLPRLLKLSDRIYSGAEPKVEQAFAELQKLGVKTIIGVDGAKPKLEWAAKYGMEYVHIPIGYDGVSDEQAKAFAYVMQKKPGPYYFHCHHGRHRGPAAAAIAYMASESCGSEGGVAVLTTAKTSPNYPGLWRDIKAFQCPSDYSDDVALPEVAGVSDFNSAMAGMDRTWDEIKLVKKAGWKVSAEHPDLDPQHTALILSQAFADLHAATPDKYAKQDVFAAQMEVSLSASQELSKALEQHNTAAADIAYQKIGQSCKKCHFEYRDQ